MHLAVTKMNDKNQFIAIHCRFSLNNDSTIQSKFAMIPMTVTSENETKWKWKQRHELAKNVKLINIDNHHTEIFEHFLIFIFCFFTP